MAEGGEKAAGMTINWFSSFQQAAEALPLLAPSARVIAWTHEPRWLALLDQQIEVRRYDPVAIPWIEINAADMTIYHLGADAETYGLIWQVCRQHPGIVVLHELNLQPLFAALAATLALSREEYLQMMEFHHPDRGRDLGEAILAGTRTALEVGLECPLTAAGFENALAVVVHNEEDLVRLAGGSGVLVLQLPPTGDRERYVNCFMTLLETVDAARPQEAMRWVSGRAGQAMKPWFTPRAARVLLPPLAAAIGELFDAKKATPR